MPARRSLSPAEWLLLAEATLWLAAAILAIRLVAFRRIAPWIGTAERESPADADPASARTARRVGWAVRAMARRVPWPALCLAQALAATAMLRRRGVDSTLYLGVSRGGPKGMEAHAWVRCGADFLTGDAGRERFTTVARFAGARR